MAQNGTAKTDFQLVGFPMTQEQGVIAFIVFLHIYILTILANILIIILVNVDRYLHKPMYFFLGNFSFLEIWYTSTIIPKMLVDFLSNKRSISQNGCIAQFYFCCLFGTMENLLLSVMALDRLIAICYPLRYPAVMNNKMCAQLVGGCWISSCVALLLPVIPISQLSLCGPFVIDHIFCDFSPLLRLSCIRNSFSELSFLFLASAVILACFSLIMVSYIFIISTIMRISSATGRQNAITTCASHLTVVFVYYGTVIFMYVRPSAHATYYLDKVVTVIYVVVTPLLNPIIYSLRNQEVKAALRRTINKLKAQTKKEAMCSM